MRLFPLLGSLLLSACAARAQSAPIAACPAVAPIPPVVVADNDADSDADSDDDQDDDDVDVIDEAALQRAIEAHVSRVLARVERELAQMRIPAIRVPRVKAPRVRVEFDD